MLPETRVLYKKPLAPEMEMKTSMSLVESEGQSLKVK